MAYYLDKIEPPGPIAYVDAPTLKQAIEAVNLAEAKELAEDFAENHPRWSKTTIIQLFDETGLVATRRGSELWGR